MHGQSQDAFFAPIQEALKDRGEPIELPDDLEVTRVISVDEDIPQVFIERVEAAGMHAHRVSDAAAAGAKAVELIVAAEARSVVLPDEEIPGRDAIVAGLEDKGILIRANNAPDAPFEADVGITGVTSAVAETGSMCIDSGDARRRLASLAVPTHIGIVRVDQIMADLLDFGAATPDAMPANRVLVSGPSKTADIEMIIIEGVHGPKIEHVIVVG